MSVHTADVCVIGAGPAGAVMATRLAQLGVTVCLVERAQFPRPRLGESLSPGVMPLLNAVGAGHAAERAGHRVQSVASNWNGPWTERADPGAEGMLVDRGRFDALLVERARAVGVDVLHPAVVHERVRSEGGWSLVLKMSGTLRRVHTRFIVDAAGRASVLPTRRRRTGPRTIALHAWWEGRRVPAQPRIEAGEDGWYWGVPLPDGRYNTLVFVDAASVRALAGTRDEHFHALIARSSLMQDCDEVRVVGRVLAADATPYLDELIVSPTHIKVGDAALAIDPLSSSGVQKAIQSALSGAIVANTLLRWPERAEAAMQFYRESLAQASERHRVWAMGHYAAVSARSSSGFWRLRAGLLPAAGPIDPQSSVPTSEVSALMASNARVRVSPEAEVIDVPRLEAERVGLGPALRHPALDGPVAYLGGWELAPLLNGVRTGMTPLQVVRSWAPRVPVSTGISIAGWMLGRGILVVDNGGPAS
jgi:flavin-dependent dehydrogenase